MARVLTIIGIVGLIIAAFFIGTRYPHVGPQRYVERDTIVVRDTVRIAMPNESKREPIEPQYKRLKAVERDTVILRDTLYLRDSVLVEVPTERVEYRGKDYFAIVEGYNPRLSYIETYPETRTITETRKERKRWGITLGVQGGYGITPVGLQPYSGVGITFGYNF